MAPFEGSKRSSNGYSSSEEYVERTLPIKYGGSMSEMIFGQVVWIQDERNSDGSPILDKEGRAQIKFCVNMNSGQMSGRGEDRKPIYSSHWFTIQSNSKSLNEKGDKSNYAVVAEAVRLGVFVLINATPQLEEDGNPRQYETTEQRGGQKVDVVATSWSYYTNNVNWISVGGNRETCDMLHALALLKKAEKDGDTAAIAGLRQLICDHVMNKTDLFPNVKSSASQQEAQPMTQAPMSQQAPAAPAAPVGSTWKRPPSALTPAASEAAAPVEPQTVGAPAPTAPVAAPNWRKPK